jgi:hypothetical protein
MVKVSNYIQAKKERDNESEIQHVEVTEDDRSKFSFGHGYHEYRNTLKTKQQKMKHYAESVPRPTSKQMKSRDISNIAQIPGSYMLPAIKELHQSAEKRKQQEYEVLEKRREHLLN